MLAMEAPSDRHEALAGLKARLRVKHRETSDAAFVRSEGMLPTGFPELDAALAGGFPRGIIATLEGPPGSGRFTLAARLLALASRRGLGALVQTPAAGAPFPPALAAAGIALERLLVISAVEPVSVARAADILLRSAAFGVVVIPAIALRPAAWTRLAGLAHRSNALLLAVGIEAPDALRFFASLRVRLAFARVRWAGEAAPFTTLAGYEVHAGVIKAKHTAPGKRARVDCTTFEADGPELVALRHRDLAADQTRIRLAFGR